MEKIILVIIGITAVGVIVRLLWKVVKGEIQCHCAEGNCSNKKDCPNKKEE